MSLLDKIDKENFNVLITDSRCVIYSGDTPNEGVVIPTADIRDFIYNRSVNGDFDLFYPVTRYFNNQHTHFIIERAPRSVYALDNKKEFLIPWHYLVVELHPASYKVLSAKMFFRPFVPSVNKDLLYVFPNAWTDDQCNIYESLIEMSNDGLSDQPNSYESISNLFTVLYSNYDSKRSFQPQFLPDDFDDEKTDDWTFDVFHANLTGMDLEKLLYLDYKPFSYMDGKVVVNGEDKASFETIIATLDTSVKSPNMEFLDMIEIVLESRE